MRNVVVIVVVKGAQVITNINILFLFTAIMLTIYRRRRGGRRAVRIVRMAIIQWMIMMMQWMIVHRSCGQRGRGGGMVWVLVIRMCKTS